jgi:predicted GH43/DUF377 family glycosyl hydrolase
MTPTPEQIISTLTDPLGVAPWMLEPESDDYVRDGFAPRGSDFRDFSAIRVGDRWHVLYTDFRINQHSRTPGQGIALGHVSSRDLINWDVHEPALFIDPGGWDGRAIWAPYLLEHEGIYYVFYTGLDKDLAQGIGVATSTDLAIFRRHPANPVFVPRGLDWCLWTPGSLSHCRDPHVLRIAEKFYLYYTALCKTGEVCVAAAESCDLLNWSDVGPVAKLMPHNLDTSPICLESSLVLPWGNGYILSYSYDHAIYICFSPDPLAFDLLNARRVLDNHLDLERVLELRDGRWLVAFFSQIAKGKPSRLYSGILDLSAASPCVQIVTSRADMAKIMESIQ